MNLSSLRLGVDWKIRKFRKPRRFPPLPFYFDPLFATEFIGIEKLAMFDRHVRDQFGHFYVEAAIFRDFHEPLFAPPFDGVDSSAGLAQAEGRLSDVF